MVDILIMPVSSEVTRWHVTSYAQKGAFLRVCVPGKDSGKLMALLAAGHRCPPSAFCDSLLEELQVLSLGKMLFRP